MNWLESFIYGLVSGLAEFLPISSQAHQTILLKLFGYSNGNGLQNFLIHLALLLSILTSCRNMLERLSRENKLYERTKHQRGRRGERKSIGDLRIAKTATVPMVIMLCFSGLTASLKLNFPILGLLLLLNGLLIFIPQRMLQGNKNSMLMSQFDSILIGFLGGLSVFPGISRIAATTSAAIARGADKQNALSWSILLSIPALLIMMVFDIIGISAANAVPVNFWGCLLSIISAYLGGYLSLTLMRSIISRANLAGFAYYSFGTSLLTFILYMIVV